MRELPPTSPSGDVSESRIRAVIRRGATGDQGGIQTGAGAARNQLIKMSGWEGRRGLPDGHYRSEGILIRPG